MKKKPSNIWWAVIRRDAKGDPMPCIAGRTRNDARWLVDRGERVLKVRVTEVKP